MDAIKNIANSNEVYTEDEIRSAMELLFFAYRDFTAEPDNILEAYNFGRAHHRVIHFVGRNPGITVSELLAILNITKQSLSRVLSQLIREGFVNQTQGADDRRLRLLRLTDTGRQLELRVSADQRARLQRAFAAAGPEGVEGFRRVLKNMVGEDTHIPNPNGGGS
ncbi:MAG: winged helix-turn-helix transcriptional regulator [Rhodospirillales bacterium]|nr:winged helix-turn-helix transcriptional regulator [Rhodospirillales bacterium]